MARYTDAHNKAAQKYTKNNYDRINIVFPKGEKEKIKEIADSYGMSLNTFIISALNDYAAAGLTVPQKKQ